MGNEAVCTVRYDGKASDGKALLEASEIIFRGEDIRLKIPFKEIASLDASGGELSPSITPTRWWGRASPCRMWPGWWTRCPSPRRPAS